jgi:hypothetical protein
MRSSTWKNPPATDTTPPLSELKTHNLRFLPIRLNSVMALPTGNQERDALRRALHASLHDVLHDVGFDVQNQARTVMDPGMHQRMHFPPAALLASHRPSALAQSLTMPPNGMRSMMHFTGTAGDLLFSAASAAESRLYDQVRTALLQRQILARENERLALEEQYLHMLRSGIQNKNKGYSMGSPVSLGFLAAQMPHQATAPTMPPPTKNGIKALEALGSSLRSKTDPYIDVSAVEDPDADDSNLRRTRGGVSEPFPEKLHRMLDEAEERGQTDIVSFYSHGRAFGVHDIDRFVSEIMPKYFKQSKWNSFARQLNLYGFVRISSGPDAGGYYHELFLKGRPNLSFHMRRVGVPQGEDRRKYKVKSSLVEPDFYSMKPVVAQTMNHPVTSASR